MMTFWDQLHWMSAITLCVLAVPLACYASYFVMYWTIPKTRKAMDKTTQRADFTPKMIWLVRGLVGLVGLIMVSMVAVVVFIVCDFAHAIWAVLY